VIFAVSTIKDTLARVETFVRRNVAGGIDHLVVFLDDDQPDVAAFLDAHAHVTVVQTHRDGWWGHDRPKGLNRRQIIHSTQTARLLAAFPWVEWVFHIDGDEVVRLDRDVLSAVPTDVRAVRLSTREVVSRLDARADPPPFKTLLDRDQLSLLSALGLIARPANTAYFRGHVTGKLGVRPSADVAMRIHQVTDAAGVPLPAFQHPELSVLHYESPDPDEFVRKWRGLMTSGAGVGHRSSRASTARAIKALVDRGLPEEATRSFLTRIYERTALDDEETLERLGLLVRHDPDAVTRQPEPFPVGGEPALSSAIQAQWARSESRKTVRGGAPGHSPRP
jgi:Glycosyl transferase family 2